MRTTRAFLYTILTGVFALTWIVGGAIWSVPVYAQTAPNELTTGEIEGLQFMREEEKLARDVYLTLDEQWKLRVFQNISRAEQTHMDAIATLLDRYGIEDPAAGNGIGDFTDPELQALYDQLVTTGSQSMTDALRVGIAIEEIDILDLEERIGLTDEADLIQVYASLLQGSRNHLRAFVPNLERKTGETYQPQYLDQIGYDEIIEGGNGRSNDNTNFRLFLPVGARQ